MEKLPIFFHFKTWIRRLRALLFGRRSLAPKKDQRRRVEHAPERFAPSVEALGGRESFNDVGLSATIIAATGAAVGLAAYAAMSHLVTPEAAHVGHEGSLQMPGQTLEQANCVLDSTKGDQNLDCFDSRAADCENKQTAENENETTDEFFAGRHYATAQGADVGLGLRDSLAGSPFEDDLGRAQRRESAGIHAAGGSQDSTSGPSGGGVDAGHSLPDTVLPAQARAGIDSANRLPELPALTAQPDQVPVLNAESPASQAQLTNAFLGMPISFVPNVGQTDTSVDFVAQGTGYALFLTQTGAVFSFGDSGNNEAVLKLELVGSNPAPAVEGQDKLAGRVNYLLGADPSQWHTNLPTYARVAYDEVYEGIDLVYYGNPRQLEYDFVVAPGADPGNIRMHLEGSTGAQITGAGDLSFTVGDLQLVQSRPVMYQESSSGRNLVDGDYTIYSNGDVGFRVGVFDSSRTLVIDPVLEFSTYLGGAGIDDAQAIALDGKGNVYVTGSTSSANFPGTKGQFGGKEDVFVTKMKLVGIDKGLVYSTYLGGTEVDRGRGIAVDSNENAYVVGETSSKKDSFPQKNAFQDDNKGTFDAFITKLDSTGAGLLYSTFLGGTAGDIGHDITIDSAGNAYITGETASNDLMTNKDAAQPGLAAEPVMRSSRGST